MPRSFSACGLLSWLLFVVAGCSKCGATLISHDASFDAAADARVDASDAGFDAGLDASIATECTPGEVSCLGNSGAVPRLCTTEGRWTPGTPCSAFCDQGACVRCVPGHSRCWFAFDGGPTDVCSSDYQIVMEGCGSAPCICGDVPAPCWQQQAECGVVSDGLGGIDDCDAELGGCPSGFACGSGGSANTCVAVTPGATKECTPGQFDCGGATERRCSRTGKWLELLPGEHCGAPAVCGAHGYDCGLINDPSIGMVDCGACPTGYVCGRWSANRCAPEP